MSERYVSAASTHVMVDLETWSTANNARIISIGAVKFDPNTHEPMDSFHVGVAPESYKGLRGQFHLDPMTVMWWMSPERRAALDQWQRLEKLDIATALEGFSMWYGDESLPTWGNGATFDNVILRNAYVSLGLTCPWSYRHDRCFRTFKAGVPESVLDAVEFSEGLAGMRHDALYDARLQAEQMRAIADWRGADVLG